MSNSPSAPLEDLCWDALDHLKSLVRVWTPQEGVLYVNQPWAELTGTTQDSNKNDGWTRAIHADDLTAVVASLEAAMNQRRMRSVDYRLRCHNGSYLDVREWAQPWMDDTNETVLGIVHTCVAAEGRPHESAALTSGTSSISQWAHELRGPLNAILGWADLLSAGEADPDILQRGLRAIVSNARQQADIIRRMSSE